MIKVRTSAGILCLFDPSVVTIDDIEVPLTEKEFQCLWRIASCVGTAVKKEVVMDHLYGSSGYWPDPKILDVFICHIRKKFKSIAGSDPIKTVRRRGYIIYEVPAADGISTS